MSCAWWITDDITYIQWRFHSKLYNKKEDKAPAVLISFVLANVAGHIMAVSVCYDRAQAQCDCTAREFCIHEICNLFANIPFLPVVLVYCWAARGNRSSINTGLRLWALLLPRGKPFAATKRREQFMRRRHASFSPSSLCTCAGFLMFHSHAFDWIMHERQEWCVCVFFFNPLYLYDSFIHYSCVDSCVKVISCTWVWLNGSKSELSAANRKQH